MVVSLARPGATLSIVDVASRSAPSEVGRRLEAARLEFDAQALRFEEARSRLRIMGDIVGNGQSLQDILLHSEFARLQARLNSMPVIEQAKGILMAQQRCGPDQAFDLLRRASQRANVKVRVLAAQMIAHVAACRTDIRSGPHRLHDYLGPDREIPA